jgi:multidrug efflux pump subunit AcrA (membrane-fusion protein)
MRGNPGIHRATRLQLVHVVISLILGVVACSGEPATQGKDSSEANGRADTTARGEEPAQQNRVTLSEAAYAIASIEVATVERAEAGSAAGVLEVPGHVELDSARIAVISSRAPGRVERLLARVGDRVREGATVALLTSPQFLTAQSEFMQATRRAALLAGTPDAEGAEALAAAARRRLLLFGASDDAIGRLTRGDEPSLTLPVTAPFGGSIMSVQALAGTAVEPGAPIFTIADLSSVNVVGDVPERALGAVRPGARATIRVDAYPNVRFAGRVVRTKDELDPTTRTGKAVIAVANGQLRLKPGMFASVELSGIGTALGMEDTTRRGAIAIPESAVVTDGEMRYVFIQTAPRTFERRTIEVAPPGAVRVGSGGIVLVRSGLAPGERLVIRGAFVLKSELAKAAFGESEG